MGILSFILYSVLILFVVIYLIFKYKYSYWKRRGVVYVKPEIPYGNIKGIGKEYHSFQLTTKYYNQYKGRSPFVGLYFLLSPVALITDLELVKNILIKDFNYFHDRGTYYNERDDPLSAHLFSLDGEKWRPLRTKLTPTFTSGKMKLMFNIILNIAEEMRQTLRKEIVEDPIINMQKLFARYTTDVIGSCAFGIDCNSLKDPNANLHKMGMKHFQTPKSDAIKRMFMTASRECAKMFKLKMVHEELSQFFINIVRESISYRKKNNIQRPDFMDLLIKMMDTGEVDGKVVGKLTFNEVAAQAFVFFLGGFETSSTTLGFTLHELALNQEVQTKARNVIKEVLAKHGGKVTYESVMDMPYIDQILNESMRKYPVAGSIIRKTTYDYKIPNTNLVFDKGTIIWIPIYAIHNDPEYYPQPHIFDPERFAPGLSSIRHSQSFLAFGDGPRNCIGLRFGLMQARLALVTLLKDFKITTCHKTIVPIKFSNENIIIAPENGVWLNVEAI